MLWALTHSHTHTHKRVEQSNNNKAKKEKESEKIPFCLCVCVVGGKHFVLCGEKFSAHPWGRYALYEYNTIHIEFSNFPGDVL